MIEAASNAPKQPTLSQPHSNFRYVSLGTTPSSPCRGRGADGHGSETPWAAGLSQWCMVAPAPAGRRSSGVTFTSIMCHAAYASRQRQRSSVRPSPSIHSPCGLRAAPAPAIERPAFALDRTPSPSAASPVRPAIKRPGSRLRPNDKPVSGLASVRRSPVQASRPQLNAKPLSGLANAQDGRVVYPRCWSGTHPAALPAKV